MSEYFNGFETGATDWCQGGGFGVSAILTSPRTGFFCGKTAPPAGTNTAYFMFVGDGGSPPPVTFTFPYALRFAFRADTLPSSGTEELCQFGSLFIRINSSGVLSLWNTTTQLQAGSHVLGAGFWYVIEIFVDASGHSRLRVYANNTTAGADEWVDGSSSGTSPVSLFLGKINNRNSNAVVYSYDDIRAKDGVAGYLGDGKIILVNGNTTPPTYDAWSKTGGSGVGNVWCDVPYNSATYCSTNTAADLKQTIHHNNAFALGSVVINSVMTAAMCNAASGANIDLMHTVGGVEVDVPISIFSGLQRIYKEIWPSAPSILDFNGSEVGVFRHASSGTNLATVYDCWAIVDYSPIPGGGPGGLSSKAVVFVIE